MAISQTILEHLKFTIGSRSLTFFLFCLHQTIDVISDERKFTKRPWTDLFLTSRYCFARTGLMRRKCKRSLDFQWVVTHGNIFTRFSFFLQLVNMTDTNASVPAVGSPENGVDNKQILETDSERKERVFSLRIIYFTMFLISLGFSIVLTGIWPYLDKVTTHSDIW